MNLSAEQLAAPAVVETVAESLRATCLAPERLVLEVTETALLADVQAAVGTLKRLRAMGVNIALDDFGTGYSSLEYLRSLPANVIKIDRSFVSGMGHNPDDTAIVASLVSLGANVGVHVVAEGVETPEQHETLRRLGCPRGQGYLWSPAVPTGELQDVFTTIEQRAAPYAEKAVRQRRLPQPDEVTTARILGLHKAGASLTTVAAVLNGDGSTAPSGSRWHRASVARVIAAANFPNESLPL